MNRVLSDRSVNWPRVRRRNLPQYSVIITQTHGGFLAPEFKFVSYGSRCFYLTASFVYSTKLIQLVLLFFPFFSSLISVIKVEPERIRH